MIDGRGEIVALDDLDHHDHGRRERNRGDQPAAEAHGFTNRGSRTLRLVAIHDASRFTTEWLAGDEPVWRSKPEG